MNLNWKIPGYEKAKGPCCGVISCAIAAQVPFDDAWNWHKVKLKAEGFKRFKGGTTSAHYTSFLEEKGIKHKLLCGRILENSDVTDFEIGKTTLVQFSGWTAKPDTVYLVTTTGHAQILYNGHVYDQSAVRAGAGVPIHKHWGKLKKVKQVLEILEPEKITHLEFGLPLFDYHNMKGVH